jgi:phenylacetate-coenzyme A ligase PaaK-like adenylate-forming protein
MPAINFQDYLTSMMKWHFSPDTGSPFWLEIRRSLDFDPINDIRSFTDLSLFPDISSMLIDVTIEDLCPKGLSNSTLAGVFESGGTTGMSKRVVAYESWFKQLVGWRVKDFDIKEGLPKNTLAIVPGGPHIVGAINQRRAKALGGYCFMIDLDPRWVKKLIRLGDTEGVECYVEHLIDQAQPIIETQLLKYLVSTPPILVAIARRPTLVEHLNQTLEMITWGGTHMDADTLDYLKTSVFPNIKFSASYGSTMILSETKARADQDYNGLPIFDSYKPYILLEVVDPKTRIPVAYYERGQVVMNHLSQFALFPNILERDTALKIPASDDYPGVSVNDIKPIPSISGQKVIEGVY